jgi:hypothetical protein
VVVVEVEVEVEVEEVVVVVVVVVVVEVAEAHRPGRLQERPRGHARSCCSGSEARAAADRSCCSA